MKKLSLSLLLTLLVGAAANSLQAQAIADTPANRQAQADRYLKVMPARELLDSTVKALSASIPAGAQRDQMIKMMTTGLDVDAISKAQRDSMVKRLTADEIKVLADLYASPTGKSAITKMSTEVTADIMPVIQTQMMKAMGAPAANP